jgi:2,4-dienoyl-CoA reductase (NADPH2)
MEAARVAAIRRHEVWLYEKKKKLGGLMPLAALVKGTEVEDIPDIVCYLEHQIGKLGVKINLGKKFVPSLVEKIKPDVVILATGGMPVVPEIPGIDRRNVVNGGALHHQLKLLLRSLTKFWMPLGK